MFLVAGDIGPARLIDVGLARVVAPATVVTLEGVIMGTPGYMAPKQARGENDNISPCTDLYALGAVMFVA